MEKHKGRRKEKSNMKRKKERKKVREVT